MQSEYYKMGLVAKSSCYRKKGKRVKRQYMSCLFLSLVLTVPSLFGEEIVTLYNNTIYPVVAEVVFGVGGKGSDSHSLAPGTATRIKFPTRFREVLLPLNSIKATVPAQQEPIWEGGKIIGKKIMRQEKSVVLNTSPKHLTSNTSFVINANRNVSFINGIQQIDNLAIYRFIQ